MARKPPKVVDVSTVDQITHEFNEFYNHYGLELSPFKVGWYNEEVDPHFRLPFDPDTLAYVVISNPDMFENAFMPFICHNDCLGPLDLLDKCMQYYFSLSSLVLPDEDLETIHDFEMTPMRRAKVLVQPACHVAGVAYYYSRRCLDPDPFKGKSFMGVCIHPKYGGWFAIRGVFVIKSLLCPDLARQLPVDCVPSQEDRVRLIELFCSHWQDGRYRDIIPVVKKYSDDQKLFFSTPPKDRKQLVVELVNKYRKKCVEFEKQDYDERSDVIR